MESKTLHNLSSSYKSFLKNISENSSFKNFKIILAGLILISANVASNSIFILIVLVTYTMTIKAEKQKTVNLLTVFIFSIIVKYIFQQHQDFLIRKHGYEGH